MIQLITLNAALRAQCDAPEEAAGGAQLCHVLRGEVHIVVTTAACG